MKSAWLIRGGGGNKQMGECDDYPPSPSPSLSPSPHKGTIKGKETTLDGKEKDLVEITSPFVGTFYQAPSQESGPYVKVGSQVSTGQVLCIIEAMKIMNEIESDVAGDIVEICCENENYVEFGQVLFKIKTTN